MIESEIQAKSYAGGPNRPVDRDTCRGRVARRRAPVFRTLIRIRHARLWAAGARSAADPNGAGRGRDQGVEGTGRPERHLAGDYGLTFAAAGQFTGRAEQGGGERGPFGHSMPENPGVSQRYRVKLGCCLGTIPLNQRSEINYSFSRLPSPLTSKTAHVLLRSLPARI